MSLRFLLTLWVSKVRKSRILALDLWSRAAKTKLLVRDSWSIERLSAERLSTERLSTEGLSAERLMTVRTSERASIRVSLVVLLGPWVTFFRIYLADQARFLCVRMLLINWLWLMLGLGRLLLSRSRLLVRMAMLLRTRSIGLLLRMALLLRTRSIWLLLRMAFLLIKMRSILTLRRTLLGKTMKTLKTIKTLSLRERSKIWLIITTFLLRMRSLLMRSARFLRIWRSLLVRMTTLVMRMLGNLLALVLQSLLVLRMSASINQFSSFIHTIISPGAEMILLIRFQRLLLVWMRLTAFIMLLLLMILLSFTLLLELVWIMLRSLLRFLLMRMRLFKTLVFSCLLSFKSSPGALYRICYVPRISPWVLLLWFTLFWSLVLTWLTRLTSWFFAIVFNYKSGPRVLLLRLVRLLDSIRILLLRLRLLWLLNSPRIVMIMRVLFFSNTGLRLLKSSPWVNWLLFLRLVLLFRRLLDTIRILLLRMLLDAIRILLFRFRLMQLLRLTPWVLLINIPRIISLNLFFGSRSMDLLLWLFFNLRTRLMS